MYKSIAGASATALTWFQDVPRESRGDTIINDLVITKEADWYTTMFDRYEEYFEEAETKNLRIKIFSHENVDLLYKYARRNASISHVQISDGFLTCINKKYVDPFISNVRSTFSDYKGPNVFPSESDEYSIRVSVSRECKRFGMKLSVSFAYSDDIRLVVLHKNEKEVPLLVSLLNMGITIKDCYKCVENIKTNYNL